MSDIGFEIWPPHEVFYIHSMLFNTASAMTSLRHLKNLFATLSTEGTRDPLSNLDQDDVLNNLQNVVLQGGAISRYFWPVRKGHERRADLLRKACEIGDDSPLKNRDLRNAIEHFDEKLDSYLADGIAGYIFPQYVGPQLKTGGIRGHIFRAYYIDIGMFELLGHRYEIVPLANEIDRVHRQLERCFENGGRLVPPGDK